LSHTRIIWFGALRFLIFEFRISASSCPNVFGLLFQVHGVLLQFAGQRPGAAAAEAIQLLPKGRAVVFVPDVRQLM
jgi:hypothetical protein